MTGARLLGAALAASLATGGCAINDMEPDDPRIIAMFVMYQAYHKTRCAVQFGCEPESIEGAEIGLFADTDLVDGTLVALDVDAQGRVYLAESSRQRAGVGDNRFKPYWLDDDLAARTVEDRRAYIQKWADAGKDPISFYTENADRLAVLRDRDGDSRADGRSVVASWNDVVQGFAAGVLAHGPDVYVTDVPSVYLVRDADGDGEAESVDELSTGYGVKTSLGGHDLHGLTWGPDGRIYFSLGDRGYRVQTDEGATLEPPIAPGRGAVFRMHPDGSGLEEFATGLRNPQELAFDDYGNLFTGDNNSDSVDEARLVYVVEGGDSGWAMPFQTLGDDYPRGPWVAEKLWHPAHPNQPAWLVPPIAWLNRGPAGFAAYPGLGLPERYAGHFFLCDYQYVGARSGIWSFAVEPKGAGFEMVDAHKFLGGILPTDVDFAPDGRIYIAEFDQFAMESRVHVLAHGESLADPRVAEAQALLAEGMGERGEEALAALLAHAHRDVRLQAQFELARRGAAATLGSLALDARADLLARVHALWGLAQLGPNGLGQGGIRDLGWAADAPSELRAQAARAVGEAGAAEFAGGLVGLLDDGNARVRYFAAISLGKIAGADAVEPLTEVLRRNGDGGKADPFIRHAAVYGLQRADQLDALLAWADDPSPAVRMGVLLVLRRAADPRIARFLDDSEPLLVVEAARAIFDLEIDDAMPSLARLAGRELPLRDDDPQTTGALHRRVIAAALRGGTPADAEALGAHASNPANPEVYRRESLAALAQFAQPASRDPVLGAWRPLAEREPSVVYAALDRSIPGLLDGPLEEQALELALAYGRVPLDDDELLERVRDAAATSATRIASLQTLMLRAGAPESARAAQAGVQVALASDDVALRAEGRDALATLDPAAALAAVDALTGSDSLLERQRGYATLARLGTPAADARLAAALGELARGELEPALELDVVEAVRSRAPHTAALRTGLSQRRASLAQRSALEQRAFALEGGSAVRGRGVFDGAGDCRRCHRIEGEGGVAGPDLTGIGARSDRRSLLESVVDPQAQVAAGFGTIQLELRDGRPVSGTLREEQSDALRIEVASAHGEAPVVEVPVSDIAERWAVTSAMPPMALALDDRALRDLIEFLASLD